MSQVYEDSEGEHSHEVVVDPDKLLTPQEEAVAQEVVAAASAIQVEHGHHTHPSSSRWERWRGLIGFLLLAVGVAAAVYQLSQFATTNRKLIEQHQSVIDRIETLAYNTCIRNNKAESAQNKLHLKMAALDERIVRSAQRGTIPSDLVSERAELYRQAVKEAGPTKPCVKGGEKEMSP